MTQPTKDTLFRPVPSRTETKADTTNRVAREIIQSETDRRHALTEKLKAARLEQESLVVKAAPAPKARGRKPAKAAAVLSA